MDEFENKKKSVESENKKMFRSRFDIFVLNALNDKSGGSYGYDVINYIQNKTKGHYRIKTYSTIYNTLKRLEEQGFVISGAGDGETNGAARVYYTLTTSGREYLEENKQEYKYMRTLLDNLLTDEDFDLENEEAPFKAGDLKPLTKRSRTSDDEEIARESSDLQSTSSVSSGDIPSFSDSGYDSSDVSVSEIAASYSNTLESSEKNVNNSSSVNAKGTKTPRKTQTNSEYLAVFERVTAPIINAPSKKASANKTSGKQVTKQKSTDLDKAVKQPAAEELQSEVKKENESGYAVQAFSNIDKFRSNLRSEGFALKPYQTVKGSTAKSIYINKLIRDAVVLSALYMIAVMLLMYFLSDVFSFSLTALLTCGACAIAIALIVSVIWFRNPEKRRRDKINLKAINAATIGFFTIFFMIDIIVALLSKNGVGLKSAKVYSPVIVASTSIFLGLMFTVLYKSDNYFNK